MNKKRLVVVALGVGLVLVGAGARRFRSRERVSVSTGGAQPLASAPAPGVDISPACASFYPAGWTPVTGKDTTEVPSMPKPARGVPFADPTYKTCVVRVTDHAADGLKDYARNDYSRRQAFNADNSKILVTANDGSWWLYDARTFKQITQLKGPGGDAEPQWHPTDPAILYYGQRNGGLEIQALDVRTGSVKPFIDLRGKLPWPNAARAWTKSEGSPSRDARYWGFQVETENFEILGFAVWDAVDNKLLGSVPSKVRPDHVSMSPSGRWLVVSGDETTAWSRDLTQQKKIRKGGEHSDLAIGPEGHDYYVSIDYDAGGGPVYMLDLDTWKRTDLFSTYMDHSATAFHFSGKAYDKPGWVLVSTYSDSGPRQWMHRKVFAVELKEKPRVVHLAHTHAVPNGYWTEPHGSVNRDFTRVVFNSNWDVKSDDVDAYSIEIPRGTLELSR